jgi:alpha-glucosidase
MYVPRGQWYNYWTNDFVNGGRKFGLILNLTKFSVYKAIIPKYPVQQYVRIRI